MKTILILLLWSFSSCTSNGQRKVESFPNLANFIDNDYSQVDNIFPIARVSINLEGNEYSIPISYSLLHYSVDSSNFLIKGDFIDNYSFNILDDGKCRPLFKKEILKLPQDWAQFLTNTRQRFDSAKLKINLNNYLQFPSEPQWWQNDATPLSEDGSSMKFICQIELRDITTDDCCLFIFLDKKRNLVRQIYQRD